MVVLHVACIDNSFLSGVSIVVPKHVKFQAQFADVALVNISNVKINNLDNQLNYNPDDILDVDVPYNNPDLVIFHECYNYKYIKIYKYLIRKKIPYIIIPHGCLTKYAQNHKKIKKKLGNLFVFNKFITNAAAIQYLSLQEYKSSLFKKCNSYVLGNGFNSIPTKNEYMLKKKLKCDCLNLIYVGRYDYMIKGLDQLLKACKLLKDNNISGIRVNLYGVGSNKEVKIIDDYICNNRLNDIVKLNGSIYADKKRKILLKNDVFIQVSRSEGQPLGVIEAMCLGLPVILSEGTGYKKIIDDEHIGICTKTDSLEIYNAMVELKNNKDKLEYYSDNTYRYAVNNYSWSKIVKESLIKYEEIIKKNG